MATGHKIQENHMAIHTQNLHILLPIVLANKINQEIDALIVSFAQDLPDYQWAVDQDTTFKTLTTSDQFCVL